MSDEPKIFPVTKEERAIRRFSEATAKVLSEKIKSRELTLEAAKLIYRVEMQAYSITQYHPDITRDESIDLAIDIVGGHDAARQAAVEHLRTSGEDFADEHLIEKTMGNVRYYPCEDEPSKGIYKVEPREPDCAWIAFEEGSEGAKHLKAWMESKPDT